MPDPPTANNREAVLNQFLCAKLATYRHTLIKFMSLSHGIKGRTTDKAFQSSSFGGREKPLFVQILHGEKHVRSPIKCLLIMVLLLLTRDNDSLITCSDNSLRHF